MELTKLKELIKEMEEKYSNLTDALPFLFREGYGRVTAR